MAGVLELYQLTQATYKCDAYPSDDSATVYLNGELLDQDPEADHEFAYWNRDVEVPARLLRPGRNVLAALVRNRPGSSDLYLDMELTAQVEIPKPSRPAAAPVVAAAAGPAPARVTVPPPPASNPGPATTLTIDRTRRTVTLPCRVAPRKLPGLNEVYPIEVIATYPAPQGQKAHETVVTFADVRPSEVHKALEQLGLKAGKPARGDEQAQGPEVRVFLELPGADGKVQRQPIERYLVDRRSGKPLPPLKWLFTGSGMRQPDPERDDKVYGADLTGTLAALFPVTDDAVLQSTLTLKDEATLKLETDRNALPREGTLVRLVLEVP